MHKKTIVMIILCVLTTLVIALIEAFIGACMSYKTELRDYFDNSTPVCEIPDISRGFIPQGLAYDDASGMLFITGYMSNGASSPIYAIDPESGELSGHISMQTPDGGKFKGHAGGLSIYGDRLYVAGSTDACMYSFAIADVTGATPDASTTGADRSSGRAVSALSRVDLRTDDDFIRVSFTSEDESRLYAGEFHKGALFYTHDSHLVTTDGTVTDSTDTDTDSRGTRTDSQKAYLFGFTIDGDDKPVPECVYSIPDGIQGACFADGYIWLSQSRGLKCARILTYAPDAITQQGTKSVLGVEVPLYILSEQSASKVTTVPPMSEEILVRGDRMYILYEAAANRYLIGKALGLDKVYSTPVSYFK